MYNVHFMQMLCMHGIPRWPAVFFQNVYYTADLAYNMQHVPFLQSWKTWTFHEILMLIFFFFFLNNGKWNSHVFLCSTVLYHCDNTSILLFVYCFILFITSSSECVSVIFLQTPLWAIAWVTHMLADCIWSNWNNHTSCPQKSLHSHRMAHTNILQGELAVCCTYWHSDWPLLCVPCYIKDSI